MTEQETEKTIPVKPKRVLNAVLQANMERVKAGHGLPGAGRPKGSKHKFSEAFVHAFAEDFEKHGKDAIAACRKKDPAAYINAATRLMPKDFNINVSDEATIGKLLDKFSTDELRDLAKGLAAIGASSRLDIIEGEARELPD